MACRPYLILSLGKLGTHTRFRISVKVKTVEWIWSIGVILLGIWFYSRRPSLASRVNQTPLTEDEEIIEKDSITSKDWAVLVVFPMDYRGSQPIEVRATTRKTARDKMEDLLVLLQEHDIPFRTELEHQSFTQAEKVLVPIEFIPKSKELLSRIKIRPEFW